MSSKERILSFGLKLSSVEKLYKLLRKNEDHLEKDLESLMVYLEKFIMDNATIDRMEDLVE